MPTISCSACDGEGARGVLQPSAAGRGGLRSYAGFQRPQLLIAGGQYLGERIGLEVGEEQVTAWRLGPWSVQVSPGLPERDVLRLLRPPTSSTPISSVP